MVVTNSHGRIYLHPLWYKRLKLGARMYYQQRSRPLIDDSGGYTTKECNKNFNQKQVLECFVITIVNVASCKTEFFVGDSSVTYRPNR